MLCCFCGDEASARSTAKAEQSGGVAAGQQGPTPTPPAKVATPGHSKAEPSPIPAQASNGPSIAAQKQANAGSVAAQDVVLGEAGPGPVRAGLQPAVAPAGVPAGQLRDSLSAGSTGLVHNSGHTAQSGAAPVVPPWHSGSHGRQSTGNSEYLNDKYPPNDMTSINDILRLNLGEIKLVLQKLASVNSTPIIALNEAAELLCKHLSVTYCSITGFTDHCTSYILLAAYGEGASEAEKMPVMRGPDCSCAKLLEQPACLHYKINSSAQIETLPPDFQVLAMAGGLNSFLSIPITTDHEVLGALTIAKEDTEGFDVDWWEPMLGCLSMGLLTPLRNDQTTAMCQLMKVLDTTNEYVVFIHHLLRGAFSLLTGATNIRTGCRLALLNTDNTRALIFEPDKKQFTALEAELSALRPSPNQAAPTDPQINVTEISVENTLLLDAVQKGKARFVSDCASYIQSCMKPATDIFISGQEMVASIVVLPLICEGTTFGGFYVTLETTSNFQKIKDLLMGFVNSVVLILYEKLSPQREQIWDSLVNRVPAGEGIGSGGSGGQDGTERLSHTASGLHSGVTGEGTTQGGGGTKAVIMKRSCTEAMLKVLQHEIRKTHAKSQAHEWIEELSLSEIVGKGGFGVVYKGSWKGSVAAVKVMYARQHERQAMKDALEMAVLTTVSHPNIIQVYNCFTDMVEDASGSNQLMSEGRIDVRFRRLQPDEDRALATCNILVMEFCDRASLRHAMKKGVFHKRLGNTSVAVDLCAIVQVLVEVAQAIQHLHAMKLIHCDIKPENVLLKSDPSKPLGFVTKLSDFGLAKLLRENYYIVNRSGSGTVTHLAPELFQVGSKLTTAVDTFSFGIMMWELYTGQRAYGGLGRDAIIDRVYKKKARPIFPLGVPPAYASLAKACWDNDSSQRPPFTVVLAKLGEMLSAFTNAASPPAAPSAQQAAAAGAAGSQQQQPGAAAQQTAAGTAAASTPAAAAPQNGGA